MLLLWCSSNNSTGRWNYFFYANRVRNLPLNEKHAFSRVILLINPWPLTFQSTYFFSIQINCPQYGDWRFCSASSCSKHSCNAYLPTCSFFLKHDLPWPSGGYYCRLFICSVAFPGLVWTNLPNYYGVTASRSFIVLFQMTLGHQLTVAFDGKYRRDFTAMPLPIYNAIFCGAALKEHAFSFMLGGWWKHWFQSIDSFLLPVMSDNAFFSRSKYN